MKLLSMITSFIPLVKGFQIIQPFRQSTVLWASSNGDNVLSQLAKGIGLDFGKNPLLEGKKALVKSQAGDYDAVAVRAKLDSFIRKNPVAMLSFTTCPFCKQAKAVLDRTGAKYQVLELDTMGKEGYALRAELADRTDRTSVPAIWIGGQFVGGCNDGPMGGVASLQQSGKLQQLLKQAGAL
ncbi:hypothetical protein ACA910_008558 [Epithemia clementina (nom. ined.)]